MTARPLLATLILSFWLPTTLASASAAARPGRRGSLRQDDAASVHVAVLSVASWNAVKETLQPAFKIDEAKAMEQAIATTRTQDDAILRSSGFTLGVGLPRTSSTSESVVSTEGGDVTKSAKETSTSAPGEVPDVKAAEPHARLQQAASMVRTLDAFFATDPATTDAMTRYKAATALFQEVSLLDQYVTHAAVGSREPYLVRMQVTLLPRMRDLACDAYANISFFMGSGDQWRAAGPAALRSTADRRLNAAVAARLAPGLTELQREAAHARIQDLLEAQAEAEEAFAEQYRIPQVIPLLATDAFEATDHLLAKDRIRQLAIGLSFMTGGVGGNAGYQSFKEDFNRLLGSDVTALQTISRLNDNSLRVRFGAARQVSTDLALIPRTYNVTLLLLVPKSADPSSEVLRRVVVKATTELADATTGAPLLTTSKDDLERDLLKVFALRGRAPEPRGWMIRLISEPGFVERVVAEATDEVDEEMPGLLDTLARPSSRRDRRELKRDVSAAVRADLAENLEWHLEAIVRLSGSGMRTGGREDREARRAVRASLAGAIARVAADPTLTYESSVGADAQADAGAARALKDVTASSKLAGKIWDEIDEHFDDRLAARRGWEPALPYLLQLVEDGDWHGFVSGFPEVRDHESLWADVSAVLARAQHATSTFELPQPPRVEPFVAEHDGSAVLADDGKTARMTWRGIAGVDPKEMDVTLTFRCDDATISLPVTQLALIDGGTTLTGELLPLESVCKGVAAGPLKEGSLTARHRRTGGEPCGKQGCTVRRVVRAATKPAPCGSSIAIASPELLLTDDEGVLQIRAGVAQGQDVTLTLDAILALGSDGKPAIVSHPAGIWETKDGQIVVKKGGVLNVPLTGLTPGRLITVRAQACGGTTTHGVRTADDALAVAVELGVTDGAGE